MNVLSAVAAQRRDWPVLVAWLMAASMFSTGLSPGRTDLRSGLAFFSSGQRASKTFSNVEFCAGRLAPLATHQVTSARCSFASMLTICYSCMVQDLADAFSLHVWRPWEKSRHSPGALTIDRNAIADAMLRVIHG